jgi:hypothetical protein
VNSTTPAHRRHHMLQRLGTAVLLLAISWRPLQAQDSRPLQEQAAEDRLSPAEEELAYTAKSPGDRVAAFVKIADRKIGAARRFHKAGSFDAMALSLRGYSAAIQGAMVAVAWGEELGANMQRQQSVIRKTVHRHAGILNKLETASDSTPQPAILQVRAALASAEVARVPR